MELPSSCIYVWPATLSNRVGIEVDMTGQENFLKIVQLDANGPLPPSSFAALRAQEVDGFLVKNVFSPSTCAQIVAGLESNAAGFEQTNFPSPFRSFFFGRNLNLNEPELDTYFVAAQRFGDAMNRFGSLCGINISGRVAALMSAMDDARPFEPAPGPQGQHHFFTTFRGHRTGGYIPPHFDNEQRLRPSYRHVEHAIQGDILSFVVTLAEAEAGGMLEVFDLTVDDTQNRYLNDDSQTPQRPDLSKLRAQSIRVPAGAMIILQSGRRLHRVQPVEGPRTRWTMCSFMALSRAGDRTYCWG